MLLIFRAFLNVSLIRKLYFKFYRIDELQNGTDLFRFQFLTQKTIFSVLLKKTLSS